MKKIFIISCSIFLSLFSEESFQVVVLGSGGGPKESNVSSYLIAPKDSNSFIGLDAGSLLHGIQVAFEKNSFSEIAMDEKNAMSPELCFFRDHIKAYFISHAHLDHVAGLVINSTEDSSKSIFGIDSVINYIRDHLFNGKIWPNFGSEGEGAFHQYNYGRLELEKRIQVPPTQMYVTPFLLSHSRNYESTAFLIEHEGSYVMYFGDTAPDVLEKEKRMENVWRNLAPLALEKKLKGIFLECSYIDRPDHLLFGHLDVRHLIEELRHFAEIADPNNPEKVLSGLKVIVTHVKDPLSKEKPIQEDLSVEIEKYNDLGIVFIFPVQGVRIFL